MKAVFLSILVSFAASISMANTPCQQDHEKFCSAKKGHESIRCMKLHQAELSQDCQNFMDKKKSEAKEVRDACKEDRKRLCSEKKRKDALLCMQENIERLSETCKAELKKYTQ